MIKKNSPHDIRRALIALSESSLATNLEFYERDSVRGPSRLDACGTGCECTKRRILASCAQAMHTAQAVRSADLYEAAMLHEAAIMGYCLVNRLCPISDLPRLDVERDVWHDDNGNAVGIVMPRGSGSGSATPDIRFDGNWTGALERHLAAYRPTLDFSSTGFLFPAMDWFPVSIEKIRARLRLLALPRADFDILARTR